jgi:hypothetical protein
MANSSLVSGRDSGMHHDHIDTSRAYQRSDVLDANGNPIWVFPREEFAQERWVYKPGQHVVFAGPTQRAGKTTLAFKLLEYSATSEVPAYVAVSKPTDKVTTTEGARLGYRRVPDYPFPPRFKELLKEGKPNGYLIWPDMTDPSTAMQNAHAVTSRLIDGVYAAGAKKKKCILFLQDTVTKSKVLGLDGKMVMIITMSGAMGVGGWFEVQKPSDAGKTALWSYPNAEHVFISKDPVKKDRVYYDDIGGFDSGVVSNASLSLKPFQFLYLERSHGYMCIVDSK